MSGWDFSGDEFWLVTNNANGVSFKNLYYGQYLGANSAGAFLSNDVQWFSVTQTGSGADTYCIKSKTSGYYLRYKDSLGLVTTTACSTQERWNFWASDPIDGITYFVYNQDHNDHAIYIDKTTCTLGKDSYSDTHLSLKKEDSANNYWSFNYGGYYMTINGANSVSGVSSLQSGSLFALTKVDCMDGQGVRCYCIENPNTGLYLSGKGSNGNYYLTTAVSCGTEDERWRFAEM